MASVYIGLGSNLDCPKSHISQGLLELNNLPNTRYIICSSFYQSKPMGPQDQPDYINVVTKIVTNLSPKDLLLSLQKIEQDHQRVKTRYWGERTLDLDILLYEDIELHTVQLTIPHPKMYERGFVMYPLAEIAPHLIIPSMGYIRELIPHCIYTDVTKLDETPYPTPT
ncbi:2-amino-4-hydroxy-6-hydroxymethyldihydropteridine diphosphokinase [Candidatus Nitrosacidococcus tergens]|uniref:2-amino-4-hydroxy-6-hydroxymethyldihydropteridine pyrophosphokinase n=1 Tax=Candidatus Nitrosacidococcus tergens TaxID=553981 RepID=A0A7G1QA82_9GAMM|nr:2-amino-4-hydroxy-6-hydroxymethyldihydropteridine diphosphokinase [Candidatus Nitrosacidococcus tergens]CAB1276360.1 2-amino-4-hydroxy-6-hydroxymethyldihyropteridine pyrophosphokinase [Candidatus Nitrosacidococcus tergens]